MYIKFYVMRLLKCTRKIGVVRVQNLPLYTAEFLYKFAPDKDIVLGVNLRIFSKFEKKYKTIFVGSIFKLYNSC